VRDLRRKQSQKSSGGGPFDGIVLAAVIGAFDSA